MNGWQRLWVVISVLLGLPAALIAYEATKSSSFFVELSAAEGDLPRNERDRLFWARAREKPDAAHCQRPMRVTLRLTGGWYVECRNTEGYKLWIALLWGAGPGVVLWIFGAAVAWVRRGFRMPR